MTNDQQIQAVGLIATVSARERSRRSMRCCPGCWPRSGARQKNRIAFADLAATRQADVVDADYILSPANLVLFNSAMAGSGPMQQDLTGIEQAIAAGTPVAKLPITLTQWQHLAG